MYRLARVLVAAIAAAAALGGSLTARADTQPVLGTVISTLGISVSGPVVLTNFAPGQTATGTGTVTVVSTGPWVLRVSDANATNPGYLLRTSGTTGETALQQALDWSAAPALGTGHNGTLSGTATVAASGNLSDSVAVSYSQQIGSSEQLATGSVYSLTATWTISAT
jgi:hypothetical protein